MSDENGAHDTEDLDGDPGEADGLNETGTDNAPADAESITDREQRLELKAERLDQREEGLDRRAERLGERADELDDREEELHNQRDQLDELRDELDEREAQIEQRTEELDDREVALQERERDLSDRTAELDRYEQILEEYVGDNIADVEESLTNMIHAGVSSAIADTSSGGTGRFGRIESVVIALVGILLIVGGIANGFATQIDGIPALFTNTTTNVAATAILMFVGLAVNLAVTADRA